MHFAAAAAASGFIYPKGHTPSSLPHISHQSNIRLVPFTHRATTTHEAYHCWRPYLCRDYTQNATSSNRLIISRHDESPVLDQHKRYAAMPIFGWFPDHPDHIPGGVYMFVRMCIKIATHMIQFAQVDQRARRAQRCYRLVRSPHMNLWLQHKWNGHQLERSTDDVMWVRNAIRMTTYLSAIYVGGRIWHWWFLCICLYLLGVIKNNVLAKCLQMNWTSWVERKCVDNMSGPW